MNNQLKHSESGRTMLEMLGVLGIMGIIMYGAIAGINYGMSTYKINQTYNEVQEAIQGIQDLYSWSRNYSGLATSQMCPNDIFTNCPTAAQPVNSFGGNITVASISGGNSFTVTYADVDEASCNRLYEMEWGPIVMEACSNSDSQAITFCPKTSANQSSCP